jgi:hypothetical protein
MSAINVARAFRLHGTIHSKFGVGVRTIKLSATAEFPQTPSLLFPNSLKPNEEVLGQNDQY